MVLPVTPRDKVPDATHPVEPLPAPEPAVASRSRKVVLLVLVFLTVTISVVALYLFFERKKRPKKKPKAPEIEQKIARGRKPAKDAMTDRVERSTMKTMTATMEASMKATARPTMEASMKATAKPTMAPVMATMAVASPDATRPPPRPGQPSAVPPRGRRRPGDLDVYSKPRGAAVILDNQVLGKTPVRLRLKPGKFYHLVINKIGYQVRENRVRMPKRYGLRLFVWLPYVTHRAPLAKPGQTAVAVTCKHQKVFRVFLNGRNTGRNCPVTLKVGRGRNNVGIYVPRKRRVVFKYFSGHANKATPVHFDY